MSLNWNIEACNLTDDEKKENWSVIENIIWSTMVVDIGEITSANIEKFEFRLRIFKRITGSELYDVFKFLPRLIGLKTNVITGTDKQFEKKVIQQLNEEIKREIRLSKSE